MKKNIISLTSILSAILLFSVTVGAQITNHYDLSAYKLPDYRYRQLITNFELSGANNSDNLDDQKFLNRSIDGNIGANYYSYLNSRKTQRTHYLSFNFRGYSFHDEDPIEYCDNSSVYSSLNYQLYNKRYFANKTFLVTGVYARNNAYCKAGS